jgi:hypothetical protein
MATKKKTKTETMTVSIELPIKPVFAHFVKITKNTITFLCQGNSKWIDINPINDIANDLNYCPYCGAKLDGLDLHKSISKLVQPNERYAG